MDKSLKSISEAYLSMLEATKVEVEDEKETEVDTEKKSTESDAAKDDPAANKGTDDEPKKDKKDDKDVEEACSSKKKMKENLNFTIAKSKAGREYQSRKARERQDAHRKQDPKHAKTHARNMVDMDKAEKKAKKKGVSMRDYGRDNWKVRNGVKRGKLPEQFEAMMVEAVELNEASTRDYVDNILPKALKKAGIPCKVSKKTGYTSYDCGDYEIINDGVGIKVKENGKEIAYYSKPKLDYKKAVSDVNESTQLVEFMKFDAQDAIRDFKKGKVAKIKSSQSVTATVMPVRGNSWDTDNGYVPVLKNFSRKGKMTKVDLKAGQEVAIDTQRGNVYGMVGDKFFYTSTGNVDLNESVEIEEGKKLRNVLSDREFEKSMKKALADKSNYKGGKVNWSFIDADVYMELTSKGYDLRHPSINYMDRFDKLADKLDPANVKESVEIEENFRNRTLNKAAMAHGFKKGTSEYEKNSWKHPKTGETLVHLGNGTFGHSRKDGSTVKRGDVRDLNKHLASKGYKVTNESVELDEASGDKEAYQKFFKSALKKFGVKSPAELDGDKEKEFYDYVDKNWEGDNEVEESVQLDELAKYTDKQIKMAFGIINDKRWKGGNMTHIVKTIEKIAKGLSKHPSVEKAIRATNESALQSIKTKLKGE